jgi:sec-independent protein translocase protein TatA
MLSLPRQTLRSEASNCHDLSPKRRCPPGVALGQRHFLMFCRSLHAGEFMFEGLFQPMHLLIIAGIALLVFGPKKLPELGKGLGESIRGFKSAMAKEEKPLVTHQNVTSGNEGGTAND